jgi:hypothetical protein
MGASEGDDALVTTQRPEVRRWWPIVPLVAAIIGVAGVTAVAIVASGGSVDPRWVPVGMIDDVNRREIVFVPQLHAYVVADPGGTPITLLAESPQMGEPVELCATSMWFEDAAHGSKFDQLGRYALGPAPRGLDRLPTTVRDGVVLVDPTRTLLGPPRGEGGVEPPVGPFCVEEP